MMITMLMITRTLTLHGASCLLLYEGGGGCGGDDDYDADDYSHSDSAWCFLSPTL